MDIVISRGGNPDPHGVGGFVFAAFGHVNDDPHSGERNRPRGMHVRVWSFQTRPGREREFELMYGPEGDWVRLLQRGDGYIGTELWRCDGGLYLTSDWWQSEGVYDAFRARFAEELEEIDRRGEELTKVERLVGLFEVVSA